MSRFRFTSFAGANFSHMLEVWGNGNAERGFALFNAVTMRLAHARRKHPVFAAGSLAALAVIGAEFGELCQAVEGESGERQRDECLDVMATALRFCGGEWQGWGEVAKKDGLEPAE